MSYLIHGYPLWQWLAIAALFFTAGAIAAAYPVWRLAERSLAPAPGRHAYRAPEPDPDPDPQPGRDDTIKVYADITGPIPMYPWDWDLIGEAGPEDPNWVSRLPAEEPIEWGRHTDPYLTRLTAETEADVLRAMIRLDEDASAFMAQRAVEFEATRSMLALAGPR